jgi:hypothetical protein
MIFEYKNAKNWDPILYSALASILGDSYIDKIKKNSSTIKYNDSDDEGCDLFSDLASREQINNVVKKIISHNFNKLKVYHACRADNVDSYYKNGLIPLTPIKAQEVFRDCCCSFASQEDIDTAINAVTVGNREGRVHVCLDDRVFFERSGQYLIYGSEYICCLAFHLPQHSEKAHGILRSKGKATVLICHLPFSVIVEYLDRLLSIMIADHFFRIANSRRDVHIIDFAIDFSQIQPENIIDRYFPVRIKDPYKPFAIWNDELMKYE